jgi:hypothetical protein
VVARRKFSAKRSLNARCDYRPPELDELPLLKPQLADRFAKEANALYAIELFRKWRHWELDLLEGAVEEAGSPLAHRRANNLHVPISRHRA